MEIINQKNDECEFEHLHLLRIKIKQNPNLDTFSEFFDDHFLKTFLRARKYDSQKAFVTLENYIKVRKEKYPKFFRSLRPSTTTSLRSKPIRILKNTDQLNRAVGIDRIRLWDPIKDPVEDCIKLAVLLGEEAMSPQFSTKSQNGFVGIVDLAQYNFKHALALTPSSLLQAVSICYSFPLQYKAVHFVNEPSVFTMLLKGVSPFFPKKLRKRLHYHGSNLSSLHKHVPPMILPQSLGGMLPEEEAFDSEYEERILLKDDYYEKFAEKL